MYRRYFEPIFGMYQWYFSYRSMQPTEICDVERSFLCVRSFYGLNTTFSASRPITNLNCVFISYTSQRLRYYNPNYNKNIVLLGKCLWKWLPQRLLNRNLLNSCALWQSHACAKERKHAVYLSTQKFSTQFTAKDIDFLHFSSACCQKHIKMNIEWTGIVKPVPESST